jgi:putative DNA primase/helicase
MDPLQLAGVLRWAVEGCQQYLEHGLNAPEEVATATKQYRAESDVIGRFIEECCVRGEYTEVKARELYQTFLRWAEKSGETPVKETAFGRSMAERGYDKKHTENGNRYLNLGLRHDSMWS